MLRITSIALCALALAACVNTGARDAYYAAQEAHRAEQRAAQASMATAFADAAAECTEDSCRVAMAGFLALSTSSRGGTTAPPAQFREQPSPVWGVVDRVLGIGGSAYAAKLGADTAEALYDTFGGMFRDVTARPSIQVGGDYVTGEQHVGDSIGGDYITGHVGDAIGGDQVGGDDVDNSGVLVQDSTDTNVGDRNDNSGRQDSPGPISDDGNECTGEGCQPTTPVEPDDGE